LRRSLAVRRFQPEQAQVTASAPKAEAAIGDESDKAKGAQRQRIDVSPSLTQRIHILLETFQYGHCRGNMHVLQSPTHTIQACTSALTPADVPRSSTRTCSSTEMQTVAGAPHSSYRPVESGRTLIVNLADAYTGNGADETFIFFW
jgi:hypothetical protein